MPLATGTLVLRYAVHGLESHGFHVFPLKVGVEGQFNELHLVGHPGGIRRLPRFRRA